MRERIFFGHSTSTYQCSKRLEIDNFIPASFNVIRNCSHMEKIKLFCIQFFFLFPDDDVKRTTSSCSSVKSFDISVYFTLFIRKDFLERYLLQRIKSLVGHLQFMVGKNHNLVGHLILPPLFSVGQNVRCVFRLVGQILILVGHCPMSERYFKTCLVPFCSSSYCISSNFLSEKFTLPTNFENVSFSQYCSKCLKTSKEHTFLYLLTNLFL